MPEWIHAILVGGGIGLFIALRELEKRAKKSQNQDNETQLTEFDKSSTYFTQQARQRSIAVAPFKPKVIANIMFKTDLPDNVDAFRERYRWTLQGRWENPEVVPYGYGYEFRADGTGAAFHYSGFSCEETPLQWRCPEDWVVEINIQYSPDEDDDEEPWERIPYDFVVANTGYGNSVVLCSKGIAQKFRAEPSSVEQNSLGLLNFDGPLVFAGACD